MYKTITLGGAEQEIKIAGQNCDVRNDGADVIYASAKANINAGDDGVLSIPAGQAAKLLDCRGTVYLLGTGTALLCGNDYSELVFKCAAAAGGGGEDTVARNAITALTAEVTENTEHISALEDIVINDNQLINPNFRVNQRRASGTITEAGYFVDRWELVSGAVTVNTDGTITLDGTIQQTLETRMGGSFVASASAGTASYDDESKTFTLSASGAVVEWAKLEAGDVPTAFSPPVYSAELNKCQRFFVELNPSRTARVVAGHGTAQANTRVNIMVTVPVPMRTTPTVTKKGSWSLRPSIEGADAISANNATVNTYSTLNSVNNYVLALNDTTAPFTAGQMYYLQGNKQSSDTEYPTIQLDAEL